MPLPQPFPNDFSVYGWFRYLNNHFFFVIKVLEQYMHMVRTLTQYEGCYSNRYIFFLFQIYFFLIFPVITFLISFLFLFVVVEIEPRVFRLLCHWAAVSSSINQFFKCLLRDSVLIHYLLPLLPTSERLFYKAQCVQGPSLV